MRYVLYNPLSIHSLDIKSLATRLREIDPEVDMRFINVAEIDDGKQFMDSLRIDDDIVISGGDGTLNRFVNKIDCLAYQNRIYLHKAGNSNDFMRDVNELQNDFIEVTNLIKKLPVVTIRGDQSKFLNNVGFGIDGMVSVETNNLKAKGKININYKSLVLKLLIFKYKKVNALINVDGREYKFNHVYLASCMNGKYYGNGMKQAPEQDRKSDVVSLVIWHGHTKLSGLFAMRKVLTGEHILDHRHVNVFTGRNISVTFDKPTDIQIDGEAIHGVFSYHVEK